MENTKKFYTVNELCEMLHVNKDSIYRYIREGKLESVKIGRRLISEEALQKFLNSKK